MCETRVHMQGVRRLYMVDAPTAKGVSRMSALRRKRRLIWRNTQRNAHIAALATAVQSDGNEALSMYGIEIDRPSRWPLRVAILVECTEQGQALMALLRGWELLDAVPAEYGPNYDPDCDPSRDWRPGSRLIVTLMYAVKHDVSADVLIRATGGRGSLTYIPEPTVLIDIADGFDARAEADTLVRIRDYRLRGWGVIRRCVPRPTESRGMNSSRVRTPAQ